MLSEKDLRPYQSRVVEHLLEHPNAGLFMGMGLGKTVCTLTAFQRLKTYMEAERALVVGPPRVAEMVWSDETTEWAHLKDLKVLPVFGSPAKRKKLLREPADVYTLSVHNISWFAAEYPKPPADVLIIDESSMFKSHSTNRFKDLKTIVDAFDRVIILTGTPTPNSLIELWPQLYLLDRGKRLGKNITAYRQTFFTKGFHQFSKYRPRKGADEAIHERISDICISLKTEEYLDLPEKVMNSIKLTLPDKLVKQYKQFERDYIIQLVDEFGSVDEIPAMNAAALSNKLRQFANGTIYNDERDVKIVHNIKLDVLEERVDALNGDPVLIACNYIHERDRVLERLKKYGVQRFEGMESVREWNKGNIPVLVSHPASMSHGLNMQKGGNNIIWFGPTWSLEQFQQMNARLYRSGQTERTIIHILQMKGTIDTRIMNALEGKSGTQDAVLEALKLSARQYGIQ